MRPYLRSVDYCVEDFRIHGATFIEKYTCIFNLGGVKIFPGVVIMQSNPEFRNNMNLGLFASIELAKVLNDKNVIN